MNSRDPTGLSEFLFRLPTPLPSYTNLTHRFLRDAVNTSKSPSQRQGDANPDAVSASSVIERRVLTDRRGLDNAGKTTIVKKIMNEDVNSVSPTLGFIIKTIDYDG